MNVRAVVKTIKLRVKRKKTNVRLYNSILEAN